MNKTIIPMLIRLLITALFGWVGYTYIIEIIRAFKDFGHEYSLHIFSQLTVISWVTILSPTIIAIHCIYKIVKTIKKLRKEKKYVD